jgi:hypothetical protein
MQVELVWRAVKKIARSKGLSRSHSMLKYNPVAKGLELISTCRIDIGVESPDLTQFG